MQVGGAEIILALVFEHTVALTPGSLCDLIAFADLKMMFCVKNNSFYTILDAFQKNDTKRHFFGAKYH
ncbi:MAG: hypothetical protein K2I93_08705, partial [Oscillospiraceae bacterium]|nr:hypothetical protein [Oscillospiraceae bacterium]